jgi:tRNA G18 (ribose-2'-O)-methylase SpoU
MQLTRIDDAGDPRLAPFRSIRERDLLRGGTFIAEGKFILETLLTRSRFPIRALFLLEDRLPALDDILSRAPDDLPVHVTSRVVMDAVAGFPVHRGILALGDCDAGALSEPDLATCQTLAILAGVANPDNVGAIFRNAAGLGIDAVLLDDQCCDPLYRKAIRVSMGTVLTLPWARMGAADTALAGLAENGWTLLALSPAGKTQLEDLDLSGRSAFVFGEEAHGLSVTLLERCKSVAIPMANGVDSLNVAATSAIVFDTMRRKRKTG